MEQHIDFSNKRLLLVEDNEMNIKLFSLMFRRLHINFDVAENAEYALQVFNNNLYDIVFTDINLPEMNGDEMARKIRANPNKEKSNTPIIALTASILSSEMELYMSAGINHIINKPFKEENLRSILREYLASDPNL